METSCSFLFLLAACLPAALLAQTRAEPLPPFAMAKAERLVRERLPCLGCHQLDGKGGRIGPDLTGIGARRDVAFVRSMIADPRRTLPGTLMPKVPMTAATLDLLSRFLVQRKGSSAPTDTSRVAKGPVTRSLQPPSGAELYAENCSACHGTTGKGDGFNAPNLRIPPAVHASKEAMSRRTDDGLFDAIYAGGYTLARSNEMPGFGETLTRDQIRLLVRYIRTLCSCEGPEWSRDGMQGKP